MGRTRILLVAFGFTLVACTSSSAQSRISPTATGGLTRDQAVASAHRAYPFDAVIDATTGPIDRFEPGQARFPGDHLVWAVVVRGTFQGACGPGPAPGTTPRPCPPPAKRATVVVDYFSGEFIVASFTGGT
jgi:hypothetical protein